MTPQKTFQPVLNHSIPSNKSKTSKS